MAQSPRPGAIDSWKEQSPAVRSTKGRTPRRLFLTVLFVLLVGLLIWLFFPFFTRTSLLVSLPIVHQADQGVPPVPYWAEDTRAFLDLAPVSSRELDKLDTHDAITTLEDRLRAELAHESGFFAPRLILQVTGQGVSDEGEAWLLCSDYSLRDRATRYKINDLLHAVSKAPHPQQIRVVTLPGVGLRLDWAWPKVLQILTATTNIVSPGR